MARNMAVKNTICRTTVSAVKCALCGKSPLSRDIIGINKKLMGKKCPPLCMDCLSDRLDVTVQDLLDKIEDFKEEGCTLFV